MIDLVTESTNKDVKRCKLFRTLLDHRFQFNIIIKKKIKLKVTKLSNSIKSHSSIRVSVR